MEDILRKGATISSEMAAAAAGAAALLRSMSNEHRLLILCHLVESEELTVGQLVSKVGLSQSALSQHLAKLREEGLVSFRRDAQTLFYRLCDDRAANMLALLHQMFCREPRGSALWKSPIAQSERARKSGSKGD